MSLFARRIVQRCLEANAAFASPKALHDWVKRLNKVSQDYVATEWELVLLSMFSKFGSVQHEPALGSRPIDLVFGTADGSLRFGADIVAISDESLHARNPIARFQNEFNRRVDKAGIRGGRFVFQINEQQPVAHRGTGRKRRLLLPAPNQFDAIIFNAAFDEYIRAIQREPLVSRAHRVGHQSQDVSITIEYQPSKGSGSAMTSHGSYTSTTVVDDNPLFNALKSKANQLRRSGYQGIRGIIVCDGGSRIFNEMSNWATYSMSEVVREFFRQNTSVSFVATIGIKQQWYTSSAGRNLLPDVRLFIRPADLRDQWAARLDGLLQQVRDALPELQETPENVRIGMAWNRSTKRTKPYYGGFIMTRDEVRISSRELLDLLAGNIDYSLFTGRHNYFRLFRQRGRMIVSADLEHRPDEDDDWVVLRFKDGDPATCDFTEPQSQPPSRSKEAPLTVPEI